MGAPFGNLTEVLGSPAWSVGATVLAAAAIIVSIVIARQQRARKVLGYELGFTELVSVHQGARDLIKIYYEDEQIEQAHLLQLRLINVGDLPVLQADFQRPLTLEFEGGGSPLTVEAKSRPAELRPEVEIVGSSVSLKPLLLNPGDSISVEVFARNFKGLNCDYRIIGVPTLTEMTPQIAPSLTQMLGESFTIAGGVITEPLRVLLTDLLGRKRR